MSSDPGTHRAHASFDLLAATTMCIALLTGCGSGINSAISSATTAVTSPVEPTPVAPTPVAPTPVAPTPVAPTPVAPTPVAPTPVAPTPVTPAPVTPAPVTDTPATLSNISPGVMMAGSPGGSVKLQGAGIDANATVLVDGAAHVADYISTSEVHVPLSTMELAISGRHAFSVQNPQATASAAATLLVTSWYNAFGDSITQGYTLASPSTQNYTALLAAALNLTATDNAIGGDQACDVFPRQIYKSGTGYTSQPAALQSLMVGTNDVDHRGPGYFEPVFNECHQAALAWLGTPWESRLMAGDSRFVTTGACTNVASIVNFGGLGCTAAGTITATLSTGGHPIYIWYTLSENTNYASFQLTVDGAAPQTYAMLGPTSINTSNGTHSSVALIRLPAVAGSHTIGITTSTGSIGIQAIGSNPASGNNLPRVLAGDFPNQLLGGEWSSVADQLAYSADIVANVALLAGDGIDLRLAPTRAYMLGTAAEMNDPIHPNVLGQQHLEAAFLSVLP